MTGSRKNIAVIDDDVRILESIENFLEAAGYSVLLFASAEALIEANRLDRLDCMITDIGLPGMDGFELSRIARASRPSLPVIFITGHHETTDQKSASEAQHQGFFRKPFDAAALLTAVSTALSVSGADRHDG